MPFSHQPETLRFQDSTWVAGKPQPALHTANSGSMRSVWACAVCAHTHLLLRMRLGVHTPSWAPSVRNVGPEAGVLIQSRFFLSTWDSPGRFTHLSCLEVKCACVWGGASEFRAGRAVPSGAFEEEGPRRHHLSPHRCRDTLVLVLVAGEEGWWAEENTGSDDSAGGETWGCCLRYLAHWGPGTDDRAQNLGPGVGREQGAGWAIEERPRNRTAVGLWPYRGFCGKVPREKWTGMLCMQTHLSHRRWENRHSQAVKTEPFFVFQLNSKGVGENRSGE